MPKCQKIRKGWLDQYGAECFRRLIFATIIRSVGLKGLSRMLDTIITNELTSGCN